VEAGAEVSTATLMVGAGVSFALWDAHHFVWSLSFHPHAKPRVPRPVVIRLVE